MCYTILARLALGTQGGSKTGWRRRSARRQEGNLPKGGQLVEVAFRYQLWEGEVGAGRERVLQAERTGFENAPRSGGPHCAPGRERAQCGRSMLCRGGRGTKTWEGHRIFWPGHLDPQDVLNANILNQNIPALKTFLESGFQFELFSSNLIPRSDFSIFPIGYS